MSEVTTHSFTDIKAGRDVIITLNGNTLAPSHKSRERFTAHPTVFVPRRDVQAHLVALLGDAISSGVPFALVIRGPRGSGKTTLAEDVCESVRTTVHRLLAGAELEAAQIEPDDVVFVDALLEKTSREAAEGWLRLIKAKFLIITTRLPEGSAAVRSVIFQRSGTVFEHELAGFSREEFDRAVQVCRSTPGCDGLQLSIGDTERLFHAMGGLPMAIQLLYRLSGSPIVSAENFLLLSTLSPEEALAELIASWRRAVADDDVDLHAVLFTMANVPMVGMSLDALADVLAWKAERIAGTIRELWHQGLISQVSPSDSALKLHDAIKDAFIANELELMSAREQRENIVPIAKATQNRNHEFRWSTACCLQARPCSD